MDGDDRREMIAQAYDTLERTADIDIGERDPFGEDALQKWERLRARSRAPDAAPVGRAKVEHDRRWQKWFRESFIEMMGSSTFAAIMGRIVSDQRAYAREQVEPLRRSLDRARRDLAAANAEIKRLKHARPAEIVTWRLDAKSYRITPFDAEGKPGAGIDLRPAFQQFINEVLDQ